MYVCVCVCVCVCVWPGGSQCAFCLWCEPVTHLQVVLRRPDGKIFAYSKGADNIMFALLSPRSKQMISTMQDHLHVFAKVGLLVTSVLD
jgi:hypothetical protein